MLQRLRVGAVGLLAGSLAFIGGAPTNASAATALVGSSTHALAFQHSAGDKVAYLHDGSLLVAFYNGSIGVLYHVTNPNTTPVSTLVSNLNMVGDQVTLYTVPGASTTQIWVEQGNEIFGGTRQEEIQYGTYDGTTFGWYPVATVPGTLTNGRQDPSLTWTGTYLIASWWDDTVGGGSDNAFYNWTADPTGATGWQVPVKSGTVTSVFTPRNGTTASAFAIKNGTTAAPTLALATTITYTLTSGAAPAVGDWYQFGTGSTADIRQLTGVAPTAPPLYTLTVAMLTYAHATGEADTTATLITYNAGTGGAPAIGDIFEFGSGLGTSETRTVTGVTSSAPYVLSVAALTNAHAASEIDTTATRIAYSGTAPAVGDSFQIGNAISNNGTVSCGGISQPPCNAEFRQVTGVSGGGPYVLSVAALTSSHAMGEQIRIGANLLTTTAMNSVQVAIRHSAKLKATIAVYGSSCQILTRTLLDSKNPSPANWTTESPVDTGSDDCEGNFGGPQIAIDENTGGIHVFKAVTTSNSPSWSGATYWHGTPDAVPMSSGAISWATRVVIDSTSGTTDPPDIAGAVDSAGTVFVFWATNVTGGTIKYVTLKSPYTSFSTATTVITNGANPRFPHVPAEAPLTRGIVPMAYQSGTSPYSIYLTGIPDLPGYSSLGGGLIGGPDASSSSPTRSDVFVRGTDNQLWHKMWNGSTWGNWEPLGGVLTADPGAVAVGASNIDVFARGTDNQLWENTWTGSVWAGWQPLGGVLTSGPDADSWTGVTSHADVFVRGTDGQLWHKWSDNGTFYFWEPLGGQLIGDPGAVSWGPNRIDVFVRGTDNQLWHKWYDGGVWYAWEPLGGGLTSGPDAASCVSQHLDVFVIGTDGQLWRKGFNGSTWSQWQPLGGMWTGDPGAACNQSSGAIDVFAHGPDGALWTISVPSS